MIYIVFNLLSEFGASQIAVYDASFISSEYIVLANGKSVKHIRHMAFKLSNYFKKKYTDKIFLSGVKSDWIVVDIDSIILHLMISYSRTYYNLDLLYLETSKKVNIF